MGISVSLIFIAVGAILKWAVTATTSGVNLGTVGVVLMVVGAVGLVLSLVFWSSWADSALAESARRSCATIPLSARSDSARFAAVERGMTLCGAVVLPSGS